MTNKIVEKLKNNDQDFEWYPTTKEIINKIKYSIFNDYGNHYGLSILDCGAGDGRVLMSFDCKRYAIEKSEILLNELDKSIFVIGTDFKNQTLIDKKIDVIFCNPPYSEFKEWTIKIIKESLCSYVYLVIPERWKNDKEILNAIKLRDADYEIIGEFDFLSADRKARANINIVKIKLSHSIYSNRVSSKIEPFKLWFDENFKIEEFEDVEKVDLEIETKNSIVKGDNLIETLSELYEKELKQLLNDCDSLSKINPKLLLQVNVNRDNLIEFFKLKISGLKNKYWKELFNNLSKITNRLTKKSRDILLSTLFENTNIDFNIKNAYSVVIWVIKNSNVYIDDQITHLMKRMTNEASIVSYKSNVRTFLKEEWRYNRKPDDLNNYKLDYRIVLNNFGGLSGDDLHDISKEFINDLLVIAYNLGFDVNSFRDSNKIDFKGHNNQDFIFKKNGKIEILFFVRAFANGNIHIKFNKNFILSLNVEFGRLNGWLKSKSEASNELNENESDINNCFNKNLKIGNSKINNLLIGN